MSIYILDQNPKIMLDLVPLREPKANNISTTVFHYSHKLKRQVWCESNLEWNMAIMLDQDRSVVTYVEQGIKIKRERGKDWTPDFVVLFRDGTKLIIEVKYLSDLLDEDKKEDYLEKFEAAKIWAEANGYLFVVVTDKVIFKTKRLNNCRKFMEADPDYDPIFRYRPLITKLVGKQSGITIESLLSHFEEYHSITAEPIRIDDVIIVLYKLIYENYFEFDFEELITHKSILFLANKSISRKTEKDCSDQTEPESLKTWLNSPDWKGQVLNPTKTVPLEDLYGIPKEHLDIAKDRYQMIEPLIHKATDDQVKKVAEEYEISSRTLWRWITRFREDMDIRSLVPRFKFKGRSKDDYSELYRIGIEHFLQLEKPSIIEAYDVLCAKAMVKKIEVPSYETFRRKIHELDKERRIKKREGRRRSEEQFQQSHDWFPHAEWALQTVQIDHTPIDVIVVDEEHRLAVGKPYITVAFDVHSRVVLGYTITFDKPSRLSIAMTLMNCISDKTESLQLVREYYGDLFTEEELKTVESSPWKDVRGLPRTLHMDNGSDFTSNDIKLFGLAYNIHLHYRPVKKARYGAHVERFLGTLNKRLHSLEGSTFSNIHEKGDYNSEEKAIYTIGELHALIVMELAKYHIDFHSKIMTTPIAKWQASFASNHPLRSPGYNIPMDFEKFYFDVLPSEMRVVQREGVAIFGMYYNAPEIRKWISHKNPETDNGKFRIRFDPRDIREVYFYDPDIEAYIILESKDYFLRKYFSEQALLLWEFKAAKKHVKVKGNRRVRTEQKLKFISMQQQIREETKKTAKSVRRRKSRNKNRMKQKMSQVPGRTQKSMTPKEAKVAKKSGLISNNQGDRIGEDKPRFKKREIDWSEVKKLPTDNMYKDK